MQAVDAGDSIFVHAFGAYFGLAVARVTFHSDIETSTKEGSVYHSDMFSMIGAFLFLFRNKSNIVNNSVYSVNSYLSIRQVVLLYKLNGQQSSR